MIVSATEPQRPGSPQKKRHAAVAFLLSLLLSGLGQVYDGRPGRGLILYLIGWLFLGLAGVSGVLWHFWGLCAFVVLAIGLQVAIAVDAAVLAARIGSIHLKRYNRWYVYLAVLVVWGVAVEPVLHFWQFEVVQARTFRIPAASMEPTLTPGDCFVANIGSFRNELPERGDIIVFDYPEDRSILITKRVIGLGDETLEIRDKNVFINGAPIDDPWGVHLDSAIRPGASSKRDNYGPVTIPNGKLFVLGDNRDQSHDSRFWGFVGKEDLHGRALYVYWSNDRKRIGKELK